MGEVYRAHDIRLDCIVAIKILPASFATDPDGCNASRKKPAQPPH
jgi:hypothetical protein